MGSFLEMFLLIRLPLHSKQVLKFETFSFLLLQQCLAKLYARAFLNGTCIAKIVGLV